jgi:hypothetical protein
VTPGTIEIQATDDEHIYGSNLPPRMFVLVTLPVFES